MRRARRPLVSPDESPLTRHGRTQIIRVDAKEKVRKQILRELQVGHDCNSPNIVTFYGAFQNEARDIVLCMEYMDCG